jgi:hypothetical protein
MDEMMMQVIARRLKQKDASKDMTWVKDAREELQSKRNHIAQYGMEGYFPDTIARLKKVKKK